MVGNALSGTASQAVSAPGSRFWLKGDENVRDALKDVLNLAVAKSGRVDSMPSGLQKMYSWIKNPSGPAPTFTFGETQQVYDALYNKADALAYQARNKTTDEIIPTSTIEYVRDQAKRVYNAYNQQVDAAIASKAIPPEVKVKLAAARQLWGQWVQGQEINRLMLNSTKDITGEGNILGSKLMNELDKLARNDAKVGGRPTLDKATAEGVRRYAIALNAVEESGKAGAFAMAGRRGQLVGMTGLIAAPLAGTLIPGAGAPIAAASVLSFLTPHAIAWGFSYPPVANLMIRGLKVEPGTAAAFRIGRELLALYYQNGFGPVGGEREVRSPNVPGVRGNIVPNPNSQEQPMGAGVRG
jgi:hypothetical protein